MKKIKAIIFDFGGVFSVDDDIKKFWKNNAENFGVDPEAANKITLAIWLEARVGKIDSNLFFSEAAKFVGQDEKKYKKYFIEYTGYRPELYEFIKKELYGKYKLAIISNQIESWFEPIIKEEKLNDLFGTIITSYGAGVAKPEKDIYLKALDALKLSASECIYIDDRPKNLEPAASLGMKTILFSSFDQFKIDLQKLL
ncbi:hypothetical protein C0580_04245 [Candidatus Parcubacteria bacterium]|nr:MAG: hypothetical protein C0580_04245 [Candidatus Parcubacteria bacterium]